MGADNKEKMDDDLLRFWSDRTLKLYEQTGSLSKAYEILKAELEFIGELDNVKNMLMQYAGQRIYSMPILMRNKKLGIYKDEESISEFLKKAREELSEVANEAYNISRANDTSSYNKLADEILDLVQVLWDKLYYLDKYAFIRLDERISEHNIKLENRGWENEKILLLKPIGNNDENNK